MNNPLPPSVSETDPAAETTNQPTAKWHAPQVQVLGLEYTANGTVVHGSENFITSPSV